LFLRYQRRTFMKFASIARAGLLLRMMILATAFAAPALAATTIPIHMTFVEAVPKQAGCTRPFDICGMGEVIPLGQATETIQFGVACGGACDLRIITFADGTLIVEETEHGGSCPGNCNNRPGYGQPGMGPITDVIVGGTGAYAGASGSLSGTVHLAGKSTQIKLAGTLILP
jgi:hypothetical protein